MKNFENNGKKVSENIVKLKLEQNIKSLMHNDLVCCITIYVHVFKIFDNLIISVPDNTENSLWHRSQLNFIIESVNSVISGQ